jgi:menaquinone-dependent protoporphyrinogen oxidase
MAENLLVAYATRYGSTGEVAAAVAEALRESGHEADLQPAKSVRALDGYGAVVLGAPLYMFKWHKEAMDFLTRHRSGLAARPIAIFALGPTNDIPKDFSEARAQLDKELAKFSWLSPAEIRLFGGKFDPAGFTFPHNLIPAMKKMPASDIRDWDAIRLWAAGLPAAMRVG